MHRCALICLSSILLLYAHPALGAVQVTAQTAHVQVEAGSGCDGPPAGADPDEKLFESEVLGDVVQSLEAARSSACGDAASSAQLQLAYTAEGISGSVGYTDSLEGVGVTTAWSWISLTFEVDAPTSCRIEVQRTSQSTGEAPTGLAGALPSFSAGSWTGEPQGLFVWDGLLEPGVSYEFVASGVIQRAALNMSGGGYNFNDGTDDGLLEFTLSFGGAQVLDSPVASVGQLKARY